MTSQDTTGVHTLVILVSFIPQIGFIMQVTMGTSPSESMAAAGNIFLGQVNYSLDSKQQTNKSVVETVLLICKSIGPKST